MTVDIMAYAKFHENQGWAALAFEYEKISDDKHFKLLDEGWELILHNNYPSLEAAYEIMEAGVVNEKLEEVHPYREECRICGIYAPVSKVIARYYCHTRRRDVLFNGRACEQCIDGFDSVKFRGQMMPPSDMNRILEREYRQKPH